MADVVEGFMVVDTTLRRSFPWLFERHEQVNARLGSVSERDSALDAIAEGWYVQSAILDTAVAQTRQRDAAGRHREGRQATSDKPQPQITRHWMCVNLASRQGQQRTALSIWFVQGRGSASAPTFTVG